MAHFDRAIPPGGEGKITLTVNLKDYQGSVWKSATIHSNDPQKPSLVLNFHGTVRPHIEIRPASFLEFKAGKEEPQKKTIDLITHSQPFQILKIDNPIGDNIAYHLETIVKGRHYRLIIMNRQKNKKFSGMITCFTNHSKKPEIRISIRSLIDG